MINVLHGLSQFPMSEKYTVEVQQVDDCFLELPPTLLEKVGWKEGDGITFNILQNGVIELKKVEFEEVELDFDDDELFKIMKAAHERGISFNEFCSQALENVVEKGTGSFPVGDVDFGVSME